MEKYLTSKARPGKVVLLAENAAALLLAAALFCWGFIAVAGFMQDGFMPLPHTLMVLVAIPFIMLLSWLLERKRARIHARAIAGVMCVREDGVPMAELEKITGVRKLEQEIAKLTGKGLLINVTISRELVIPIDGVSKQAVCAYCGASVTFRTERPDKCPGCGSANIKY